LLTSSAADALELRDSRGTVGLEVSVEQRKESLPMLSVPVTSGSNSSGASAEVIVFFPSALCTSSVPYSSRLVRR
jgi:hypothetical protein